MTMVLATQPALNTNVIVDVPGTFPVTTPVDEPIVATVVLLLVQVPVPVASLNVVDVPEQTDVLPEIPASGLTVIAAVAIQPVESV